MSTNLAKEWSRCTVEAVELDRKNDFPYIPYQCEAGAVASSCPQI